MNKTRVYKSYRHFLKRKDKSTNGVSPDFSLMYLNYKEDNTYNAACWNCRGCTGCVQCISCTHLSRGLKEADVKGDNHLIPLDTILGYIPERVTLHYVDYSDNLEGHPEVLQSAVQEGDMCPIWERVDSWDIDDAFELNSYQEELKGKLLREYDKEAVKDSMELYEEIIIDCFRERDDSDVAGSLLNNTRSPVMFYDTGLTCDIDWDSSEAEKRLLRMQIKDVLGIKKGDYDAGINEILNNAGYKGNLEIFFNMDVKKAINLKGNAIRFSNPVIAITSRSQGAGYEAKLSGCTIELPFDRGRLFLDECVGPYSYTEVCGMTRDWCDSTSVEVVNKEIDKELPDSSTPEFIAREKRYEDTFKAGKCTFGDMNYGRHRDVKYINNYPCGNKCPHCGTFWID